jgi:ATP-dependent Lon protease
MSADPKGEDETELPTAELDAVSTGAAADSGDLDDRLKDLPRVLRYAMLISDEAQRVDERLVAEIEGLCPRLLQNTAWALSRHPDTGLELAAELDHRAVAQDQPELRSLADAVRLLCLPLPRDGTHFDDHRRVGKALLQAFDNTAYKAPTELSCELERFVFGWAALPACTDLLSRHVSAAVNASSLGRLMAKYRTEAIEAEMRRQVRLEQEEHEKEKASAAAARSSQAPSSTPEAIPPHHLVVARLSNEQMKNIKLRDILGPLKGAINTALPLVEVPPLHQVRATLMFEFPYAIDVIDFVLAELVGRSTIKLRPLLLVGDPGGGKSRFARRLGEVLGVHVWRTDASHADGASFGGTDRRWYSAEPCHAFLAVARGRSANPLVLIDEIDKAATRNDYGRLWDCLLGFLEPETNARYPDPALQVDLDLSEVSYVATANSLDPLPSPIRDRFRIVTFPKPTANDLQALLPAVIADLARERGIDQSWVPPLDGIEREAAARNWPGGSVRRLRRIVDAILRERDIRAPRN